jgi:hypothetical protein
MPVCKYEPEIDGRSFDDEDGRIHTLLFGGQLDEEEADSYYTEYGKEFFPVAVLLDPEEEIVVVPTAIFVERFTESLNPTTDLFMG